MIRSSITNFAFGLLASLAALNMARAADGSDAAPDSIILKNGSTVRGLILKNTRDAVTIQQEMEERTYPKADIVRIHDEANLGTYFTDMKRKGTFPPWRVIANDLRTYDAIQSLEQIPATVVDTGELKNVPYMSFRANRNIELNIYGDPDDPAGFEAGLYGSALGNAKLQKALRSFVAGYLTTRAEIATLYSLNLKGGIQTAGDVTIEITPSTGADAYGGWWISVYNKKALRDARLNDSEYAKLVRPGSEVIDRKGNVLKNAWTKAEASKSRRVKDEGADARVFARGFYRDKDGTFRLWSPPGTVANQ